MNTDRDLEIFEHVVVLRWSHQATAEKFGLTHQRVSQIVAKQRAEMPPTDLAEMRLRVLDTYERMLREAWSLAGREGAPLTAGKDGCVVIDPESGGVVRDYGGRLAALKMVADIQRDTRKLLGLDAAEKIELGGAVRYELVGVDPDDLS